MSPNLRIIAAVSLALNLLALISHCATGRVTLALSDVLGLALAVLLYVGVNGRRGALVAAYLAAALVMILLSLGGSVGAAAAGGEGWPAALVFGIIMTGTSIMVPTVLIQILCLS